MLEAAKRGGSRRTVELPEAEALTPSRARRLLAGVVEAVVANTLEAGTGRTVGYLLQVEARIRESHELEERVEELERALECQEIRSR